ncbi:MAG: hypothetical protein ACK55R_13505 [Cyanobacteriota bacterium]
MGSTSASGAISLNEPLNLVGSFFANAVTLNSRQPARECRVPGRLPAKSWLAKSALALSVMGAVGSMLTAGAARAAIAPGNLCWFGSSGIAPVGTVECETYDPLTGLGTQFQAVDKLVNLGLLDFGSDSFGPKTGTLGFQYTPIDPPAGIADDQFSLILNFDPDRNGPYSGEFDYQIFITDPNYQFATAELDSIVSGVPTGTRITKRILGFADIVSTDGSNEPGVPVSGTVLTVQNLWDVPSGAVLNSFQDTYTQQERVPGPLPLFGAGMGFAFSRRLRSRIRSARRST